MKTQTSKHRVIQCSNTIDLVAVNQPLTDITEDCQKPEAKSKHSPMLLAAQRSRRGKSPPKLGLDRDLTVPGKPGHLRGHTHTHTLQL